MPNIAGHIDKKSETIKRFESTVTGFVDVKFCT
jgi:hypothetical protein